MRRRCLALVAVATAGLALACANNNMLGPAPNPYYHRSVHANSFPATYSYDGPIGYRGYRSYRRY